MTHVRSAVVGELPRNKIAESPFIDFCTGWLSVSRCSRRLNALPALAAY